MVSHHPNQVCWICGKPVALETCKTDEHGSAVHEQCYAAKVALANDSQKPTSMPLKPISRP